MRTIKHLFHHYFNDSGAVEIALYIAFIGVIVSIIFQIIHLRK